MAREYYEFARAGILNDNFEVDEFPEDIVKTSNFKS
jgi:hypothetical protein